MDTETGVAVDVDTIHGVSGKVRKEDAAVDVVVDLAAGDGDVVEGQAVPAGRDAEAVVVADVPGEGHALTFGVDVVCGDAETAVRLGVVGARVAGGGAVAGVGHQDRLVGGGGAGDGVAGDDGADGARPGLHAAVAVGQDDVVGEHRSGDQAPHRDLDGPPGGHRAGPGHHRAAGERCRGDPGVGDDRSTEALEADPPGGGETRGGGHVDRRLGQGLPVRPGPDRRGRAGRTRVFGEERGVEVDRPEQVLGDNVVAARVAVSDGQTDQYAVAERGEPVLGDDPVGGTSHDQTGGCGRRVLERVADDPRAG